ncbi:hypothetical protein ACWDPP_35355, partial [Streptomyces sp. NPDC000851]
FDGDGKADLAVGSNTGTIHVLKGATAHRLGRCRHDFMPGRHSGDRAADEVVAHRCPWGRTHTPGAPDQLSSGYGQPPSGPPASGAGAWVTIVSVSRWITP